MSSASPMAFLSPAPDPLAAARARVLAGILFLAAGIVRLGYSGFLDSDLVVVLTIGGVLEGLALSAGFVFLLRGGIPGTSTAARILALALSAVYAVQAVLSLLLAIDGVFFIALGLGFLVLFGGIAYSIVAAMNSSLDQVLRRLPLGLFVGLLLTSFTLVGEPVLVYIVTGVLFAGFGLAVALISRKDLRGQPLLAGSGGVTTGTAAGQDSGRSTVDSAPAAASAYPATVAPPVAVAPPEAPAVPASQTAPAAAPDRTAAQAAPARASGAPAVPSPVAPAAAALPVPGWYRDPAGSDQLRLWDGEQWTDQLRPWPTHPQGG